MINFPSPASLGDYFVDGNGRVWYYGVDNAWEHCANRNGFKFTAGSVAWGIKESGGGLGGSQILIGIVNASSFNPLVYDDAYLSLTSKNTSAGSRAELTANDGAGNVTVLSVRPTALLCNIGGVDRDVWHSGNDGAASGLDADFLDGQHGSYYQNAGNLNAGTIPDARYSTRAETTPTPTAGAGSFSSVSCTLNKRRLGDCIDWDVTVTIGATGNGTAAGHIIVPMGFTAAKECVGAGRQAAVGGAMCQGILAATSSNLVIVRYDNAYPGGDGERITVSGKTFV